MYRYNNVWYSSFLSMNDHPNGGISDNFQVLTVRSGSTGTGGHVTMYLEMTEPTVVNGVATQVMELTAVESDVPVWPTVDVKYVQLANGNGDLAIDSLHDKRSAAELLQTHHACYILNAAQSQDVLTAARRFKTKAERGRYIYHQEGGIKARLSSRPGLRAVNCADLVIKVLREANVAQLGYKWVSTPFRVATPV